MVIYHLPGSGIFGGIKAGYRFAECLSELGIPCPVATPDGMAPQWFKCSVATVSHAAALSGERKPDAIIFSFPHDYAALKETGSKLIFHCQGTDPAIDPVIADPDVTVLTCWPQAADYVRERTGRDALDVGMPIADIFFAPGWAKMPGCVAYMPRRGKRLVKAARKRNWRLRFIEIDGLDEADVAARMQQCETYIATSVGEWFGLPAFEAMAAGAVVVTVPVIGGAGYLRHGENCLIADEESLPEALAQIAAPDKAAERDRLAANARETARAFLPERQRRLVAELLEGPLAFLRRGVETRAAPIPQDATLSVVIITRDMDSLLQLCLMHLEPAMAATGLRYRIVVVDNAGREPLPAGMPHCPDYEVIRNDTHQGFGTCCNAGARQAPADFYLFINNDVLLIGDTLERMLAAFREHPDLGICGARLLFPDGSIQHAGVLIGRPRGGPYHIARQMPQHAVPLERERFQAVTGACQLVKRQAFDDLHGFDETFDFGYEDVDICLRAGQLGYSVRCIQRSASVHFESMTPGRREQYGPSLKRFYELWQGRCTVDG